MSARAGRRIDLIKVELRLTSPLSVAAPEVAVIKGVDLPVAKDPLTAQPYLPTTGVIGALRAHARDRGMDDASIVGLFGGMLGREAEQGEAESQEQARLTPSLVRAMGTRMVDPPEPQLRAQTAIDRRRASAVDGSLRTRESVPAGASVEVYLSIAGARDEQIAGLRDLIGSWRPVLGGGRSVGYGRATVSTVGHLQLDLDTTPGLAAWLSLGGPGTWDAVPGWSAWKATTAGTDPRDIQIAFRASGDVMVGSGTREKHADGRNASGITRDAGTPIIPGSTLKGVFRSRVEFILRSLDQPACDGPTGARGDLAEQTPTEAPHSCAVAPCLACQVFGRAGAGGRRSRLHFADATFTQVREATRAHVAIDRFTGGAAQGLLFNQTVVESGKVTITVRADPRLDLELARALIEVIALDIHDGYVGIGHGTARGMGDLCLTDEDAARLHSSWEGNRERILAAAKGGAA